jgi:TIR domain
MSIETYFSHSYRVEDQELNETFWSYFSSDFSFFVDPPSDTTIHTHLERMMRRCSAFVAVVNRRDDVAKLHCSPFVFYEYGLSVQARRPKLLLIDERVDDTPFKDLAPVETHSFSAREPKAHLDELLAKIDHLKSVARTYPNILGRQRGKIAVLVPENKSACAYAKDDVLQRIRATADDSGFKIKTIELPYEHNALFAVALDKYEAVILDVRGTELPEWVFAYVYGRLVPTLKLARLEPGETLGTIRLPPIVEGLRMDADEPGVESVLFWRDTEDLVAQLDRAFRKMDEGQTVFKKGAAGRLYFQTIGLRSARVFISNAGKANPLGRKLSEGLRLLNIERFHYKERNAIPIGSNWPEKIRSEVEACDVFVAIIGEGYEQSEWSREELRIALARNPGIVLLPYVIEGTDLKFLREYGAEQMQTPTLPASPGAAVKMMLQDIREKLSSGGRGDNSRVFRTTMLGASREAIIDTIRHIPKPAWAEFLLELSSNDLAVTVTSEDNGPVRSRAMAEQIFADARRADTDPDNKSTMVTLVRALTRVAPASHQKLIGDVAKQIAKRAYNAAA